MMINAGIARIVYCGDYPDELAVEMLRQASVEVTRLSN